MNTPASVPKISFVDLAAQRARIASKIDDAIARVLAHGSYILGPEVAQFEADLAAFTGAREVVSCANGTDALGLVLMAKGVKPGDAILCPSFTFAATAEVVAWMGATPVFVDVHETTFNIDPESLKEGIKVAIKAGLKPVGVIPVDLFGQPADYDEILAIANENQLWVLCDAAQACGATYKGRKVGTIGLATATSFFPAKPLGCYGDGGAVFTDDQELASIMRSIRVHGQGTDKYDNVRIGMNGRLDTLQAAILIEKLKIFPDEIEARDRAAERYTSGLHNIGIVPEVLADCTSVWAEYTVRFPAETRDAIAARLKQRGVPTAVYYSRPLHQQTAYKEYPKAHDALATSARLAREVLSLPMHPYLEPAAQDWIIQEVRAACGMES